MANSPLPLLTQDWFELCEGSDENEDISNCCLLGKILASKSLNQHAVSNILLVAKMTKQNAEFIGKRLGNLIGVEAMHEGLLLNRTYLRIKVEMDVTKPLPLGFFLQHNSSPGSEQMETWFVSREEGKNSPYGPNLQTSRAPRSSMPLEQVKHWVDEAEMRVQALSQGRSAVTRRVDSGGAEVGAPHSITAPNVVVPDVRDIHLGVSIGLADEEVIGPCGRAVLSDPHIEGGKLVTNESMIPGVVLGATGEAMETGPNLLSSSIAGPGPSYFVTEPSDQLIPLVEAQ
ncbi:hypothetical protein ACSBR2_028201 [Camellia fascicularis]